jgi:hypothetical protein
MFLVFDCVFHPQAIAAIAMLGAVVRGLNE